MTTSRPTQSLQLSTEASSIALELLVDNGLALRHATHAVHFSRFHSTLYPDAGAPAWHRLFLWFARRQRVAGITLGDHIYLHAPRALEDWPLLLHELTHIAQYQRSGMLPFLIRYGIDYLLGLARTRQAHQAYLDIRDEIEARRVEELAKIRRPKTQKHLEPVPR